LTFFRFVLQSGAGFRTSMAPKRTISAPAAPGKLMQTTLSSFFLARAPNADAAAQPPRLAVPIAE
jgi:hypothetical protein